MKLSGNYQVEELVRALQGNFGCQYVTKNGKGELLPTKDQFIRLDLFFLTIVISSEKVSFFTTLTENGTEKRKKICELTVDKS